MKYLAQFQCEKLDFAETRLERTQRAHDKILCCRIYAAERSLTGNLSYAPIQPDSILFLFL